jgi:Rps23 Pro-64 3,4-dihydroxylase Tpa1-like proline 4-hydroxylase
MDLQRFQTENLRKEFLEAKPFNYVVIDNFISESYLNNILSEIENYPQDAWYDKNNSSINNEKDTIFQSKKIALTDYNKMGFLAQSFINSTKSSDFIHFLSDITGIENLESDPHLYGGGIHKVANGGSLSIHGDFNIHPILNTFRRLNVLLYLNKDWSPSYNGQLELWNKDMSQCVTSIAPIFNRLIIFRITDDAYHGHPEPWNHPLETPRLSFALYYYTQDRPEEEKSPFHWALWQQRPNLGY